MKKSKKADFLVAELHFLIKQFNASPNDELGKTIVKTIRNYVEKSFDATKIWGFLQTIDEYASSSNSKDLIIELLSVRKLLTPIIKRGLLPDVGLLENLEAAEKYGEYILNIDPCVESQYIAVLRYIITLDDYYFSENSDDTKTAMAKIDKGMEIFSKIPKNNSDIFYVTVGKMLHIKKYCIKDDMKIPDELLFEDIRDAAHFSFNKYALEQNNSHLFDAVRFFTLYMVQRQYPTHGEKETALQLNKWIENADTDEKPELKRAIEIFKTVVNKRYKI